MSADSAGAMAGRHSAGDAAEAGIPAMFTVCPKCALTLAVTAADLRVAQGYVRCGRCSSVFNAIARLTEERQAGASAETAPFLLADEPVATPAPTEPAVSAPQPPAAVTAPPAPLEPEEPIP